MLSRVDGSVSAREIGYATSLSEDQVEDCLNRLEALGAIEYPQRAASGARPQVNPPTPASPANEQPPRSNGGSGSASSAVPLYDPAELDEPSNLDSTRRREILELYYRLDSLDHYQLLGVERDVDRRAVKAAYYNKVKTYHPDRYFGKDLGAFRPKLEQCFARLTAAYDTLATASSREEYDAYLDAQRATQELERALAQTVTVDDLDLLEQRMKLAFDGPASAPSLIQSTDKSGPSAKSQTVIDVAPSPESNPPSKMSDEDRRRFLARKLRVSSASLRAPPRTNSAPAPSPSPSPPPPSREQIAEQLRRQLGGAKREEQLRNLESHLAAADAALSANDPVAASNSLRIAQSLAPADPGIAEKLEHTQALAAATLSDTYLRQAEYEEKSGRFEAAARSYERAARGKPSATAWEAAARCLLEAESDLRTASEFVRMSIALAPERAASHLLLGRIFLAARMKTSAVAELERARRLDPNNDTVASLLKRIANDEF